LGTQVRKNFDSFVVRASKITLLSTKTVSNDRASWPLSRSPPSLIFEPSAPSSYTRREQLTKRRLLSPPPFPSPRSHGPTAASGKIPVKEAILALRRAVAFVDQLQIEQATQEQIFRATSQRLSRERGDGIRPSWRRLPLQCSERKAIEQAAADDRPTLVQGRASGSAGEEQGAVQNAARASGRDVVGWGRPADVLRRWRST
ncbi:hypothetical protein T484DRAFT_1770440, partial [Baffinella frigidus]